MKKYFFLWLFSIMLFLSCKKDKSSEAEFKFTKIEGNKSTATNGVLKIQWQDDKNTSWKIILTDITLGTIKEISTTTKSINENVIIGNSYRLTPIGTDSPIDTTSPCKGNVLQLVKIGSMPDLFTVFKPCTTSSLAISNVFAEKLDATQGVFNAGFNSTRNTSWKIKVTNTATSTSTTTNTAITETGNINIPLDVTQSVEITGDQNGAKASFNIKVESNANVVVSDFY